MSSPPSTTRNSASTEITRDLFGRLDSFFSEHSTLLTGAVVMAGSALRLWMAEATFLNTDEAWHFSLANQDSVRLAYNASLTISHPPLLIMLLHFWRTLGTTHLLLRLPSVIAGAAFCWIFYRWLDFAAGRAAAWSGLILATFLRPMIAMSAEVRQYPLLLMFAVCALYFLDRSLTHNSVITMLASSVCLTFAMLSHYSACFVAAALGLFAIIRMWTHRPPALVMLAWIAAQIAILAVAAFLYRAHLGRLGSLLNQGLLPQQYLHSSYFHPGNDNLAVFLYRGTFGVFRFIFGQTQIGQLAGILFVVGVILLLVNKRSASGLPRARALGILLLLPFALNWIASAAGLYPYGRMRQSTFLAIFALAGVSVVLSWIVKQHPAPGAAAALGIALLCYTFGSLQDPDALPLAEQRHEHMDQALQFIRGRISPSDVIFTDRATSFQLRHYLCRQKPVPVKPAPGGWEMFRCDRFQVISAGPNDGALTPETVAARWGDRAHSDSLISANQVWVVQGGWASGLGEALRRQFPAFASLEVHSFGRYIEIFELPPHIAPQLPQS